jgi:hypothetical protein
LSALPTAGRTTSKYLEARYSFLIMVAVYDVFHQATSCQYLDKKKKSEIKARVTIKNTIWKS